LRLFHLLPESKTRLRLIEIIQACGFDLPFTLLPIDKSADQELQEALLAPPSERVEWLLKDLGPKRARSGR
jgi:hypothetical protein